MPEGHVVHLDARRFTARLVGHAVRASSPQGRFAEGAAELDGRVLEQAQAYGKHLFLRFATDPDAGGLEARPWLHVHLGLIGGWRWFDAGSRQTDGRPLRAADGSNRRLLLQGPDTSADLRGAMTCALVDDGGLDAVVSRLGPDPLRGDADPARGHALVRRSGAPLGTLLLRQEVVAGSGLIWRCEAPFMAGIDPHRRGRDVSAAEWAALWQHLVATMAAAVGRGGPVVTPPGPTAEGEQRFWVFRRTGEPCRVCSTPIEAEPMAGRTVWWCPHCQPS